jgi:hypothetical protein
MLELLVAMTLEGRYQTTTGEDSRLRRPSTCCSELQSVWISNSAIVTGSYGVESHYQKAAGEDSRLRRLSTVVNCRLCELPIALELLVVTICKTSINPITNPNPVISHSYTGNIDVHTLF